jgi:hypothetical protein
VGQTCEISVARYEFCLFDVFWFPFRLYDRDFRVTDDKLKNIRMVIESFDDEFASPRLVPFESNRIWLDLDQHFTSHWISTRQSQN